MPRAAIIGGGLMGHGIAQVLALGGLDVVVHDPVPAALEAVQLADSVSKNRQMA
jgi:3-hydroxyacyl-CoA dehydrogenase